MELLKYFKYYIICIEDSGLLLTVCERPSCPLTGILWLLTYYGLPVLANKDNTLHYPNLELLSLVIQCLSQYKW